MDRFFYELVSASDGEHEAEKVRLMIGAHPVLAQAAESWQQDAPPSQADLYALLVIATPGLSNDTVARAKLAHASSAGFPIIPLVSDLTAYDFSAAPLPEIAERNALGLNQPDRVLKTLLHHGGLELFEGGGRVFISYARRDGSDLALALREALVRAGIGQTVDTYAFPGGEIVQAQIRERVSGADLVVLIDSKGASRSPWVAEELDIARAEHVPVIAVTPAIGGFHHSFETPHVEWSEGTGAVAAILSSVRRFLARKYVFRDRVNRTLVRLARIRDWTLLKDGDDWLLRATTLVSLRVEATERQPSSERVVALRDRLSGGRGLIVGGTRPYTTNTKQAYLAAGGSRVKTTPLQTMGSRIPSHARRRPLSRRRVFLSGSMPSESEDVQLARGTLAPFVVSLAQSLVELGAVLVFGGHPSVSPLVHQSLVGMVGKRTGRVEIHQARVWLTASANLPAEVREGPVFRNVTWHGDGLTAEADVRSLRDGMITRSLDAAVFVGGKTSGFIGDRPGIVDEYARFRSACANRPAFIVGLAGGAARSLPADNSQLGQTLRLTTEPDLAVAVIVDELLRL